MVPSRHQRGSPSANTSSTRFRNGATGGRRARVGSSSEARTPEAAEPARCLTHLPPRPPPREPINGPRSPPALICRGPPLPQPLPAAYPAPRTIRPGRFRPDSTSRRVPMRVPPGSASPAQRSAFPPAERAGRAAGYRLRALSGGGCRISSDTTMAAAVNMELDPIFLKALGFLRSKSKDSAEKLKALLDDSLARGADSSYRPSQKEVEQPKVCVTKPVSSKQDPKASSSLPSGNNNGKPNASEKVKKETEKRSADKMKGEAAEGGDVPKKPRLEKQEARSSPITVQTSKDLSMPDLSNFEETSADDFAMEMGLACVVCRQMTVISGNQLVECQECHNLYHQDCHKPQVTDKEVNDPRLVWYCARCTRQMKRMAQKTQKPPQKPAPAVVSVEPAVKDPLIKKSEIKLKPETQTTFLAFKRTEVKPSAAVSGNSASTSVSSSATTSGLTGWAAFAARNSSTNPSTAKLGSTAQSTGGKPAAASNNQKPVGLSGLAASKTGLGSKIASANNSTSPVQLKPPPPLTLGKTTLSRSVSSDNVSKVGLPSPSSTAPSTSSQVSSGNGNSGTAGNSGGNASKTTTDASNQSASLKGPTSQESQLNAMKRLQMVKKKAAQKKLKK